MGKFTKIICSFTLFCAVVFTTGMASATCRGPITLNNEKNGGTGIITAYVNDSNYNLYSDSGCYNKLSEPTKANASFLGYYHVSDNYIGYTSCTQTDFKWVSNSGPCPIAGTYYARFDCNTGYGLNNDSQCTANCANITVYVAGTNYDDFSDGHEEYVLSKWYDQDTLYDGWYCEQPMGNQPLNVGTKPNATFIGFYDTSHPDEKCMELNANGTFKNWLTPVHSGLGCQFTGSTSSSGLVAYYQCTNGDIVPYDEDCPACLKITLDLNDGSGNKNYIYKLSDNDIDRFSDSNCKNQITKAPVPENENFQGYYTADGKALCIAKSGTWKTIKTCTPTTDTTLYAQYSGVTCAAGTYLPRDATTCNTCRVGFYCVGGTFQQDPNNDQGLKSCDNGEYNPKTGSTSKDACIKCPNTYQGQNISANSRTYAQSILDCFFSPGDKTFSDETGTYKFKSGMSCPYVQ